MTSGERVEFGDADEDGRAWVHWNGDRVGAARVQGDRAGVVTSDALPRVAYQQVVDALRQLGVTVLATRSLALRYEARQKGFAGGLRESLVFRDAEPEPFADELAALLPHVRIERVRRGRLRSLAADLTAGLSGMAKLQVEAPNLPPITVALPERSELDAEAVAMAIDTMLGVHRRFGDASSHVRTLSFDHSSHGMAEGTVGGVAHRLLGAIHVNATFVVASDARRASGVQLPEPWTQLDATVAHEMWHKIEIAWETERYADSVEFRRAVGQLFGSATIEQVFTNDAAVEILRRDVSAYATTDRLEATAEMFEFWWCGPPAQDSIPARFGEVVERFFPT